MTRRTRGREIALQVLYQMEQNPGLAPAEIRRFIDRRLRGDKKLCEFADSLIAGVRSNQPRIDDLISEVAENWRLDRMAAIDRNILRLGAFELLYCTDVPTKVAINESLELAKRYSTAQSSRFVNGILDRLLAAEAAAKQAAEAARLAEIREAEQAAQNADEAAATAAAASATVVSEEAPEPAVAPDVTVGSAESSPVAHEETRTELPGGEVKE